MIINAMNINSVKEFNEIVFRGTRLKVPSRLNSNIEIELRLTLSEVPRSTIEADIRYVLLKELMLDANMDLTPLKSVFPEKFI